VVWHADAHFWARKLMAFWHTFKLMAPQFVKPYVKMIKEEYLSGPIFADRLRFVTPANMTWRISMQSAITKGSTTNCCGHLCRCATSWSDSTAPAPSAECSNSYCREAV